MDVYVSFNPCNWGKERSAVTSSKKQGLEITLCDRDNLIYLHANCYLQAAQNMHIKLMEIVLDKMTVK